MFHEVELGIIAGEFAIVPPDVFSICSLIAAVASAPVILAHRPPTRTVLIVAVVGTPETSTINKS